MVSFRHRCGAVDGCLIPILTPFEEHKEEFTDRKAQSCILLVPVSDTRRFRYFVGGFPSSRGDSLAFRGRSWHQTVADPLPPKYILGTDEFVLGDEGFVMTPFLVRFCSIPVRCLCAGQPPVEEQRKRAGDSGGESSRIWWTCKCCTELRYPSSHTAT